MKARMWILLAVGFLAGMFSMAQGAGATSLQPIGNFNDPIYMTSPPGDPRLFVVDRPGYIEVVHDGVTSQFLDIHGLTTEVAESGMLSIAFDPNYATNGLFYVFYTGTAAADGQEGLGHVDEFHVSSNPNVADVASRRPVLTITRPLAVAHHNGGQLQFGKDGLLYISVGDDGDYSAPQDLALLNGKILRIDPHGTAPGQYSIPPSNPYVSSGTARHEIWASGFRNPWRFSFDHATGDLNIADVGEDSWEEVDLAPASSGLGRGANFGWPACEGFAGSCPGTTLPVFAYPHTDPGGDVAYGCAIIGGYVYRGTQIPELAGRYLYADLCTGELRSIQLGIPFAGGDRAESAPGALTGPQSFGEDASCNLYVTNGNAVDRIVGSGSGASVCSPSINFVRPAEDATEVQKDAPIVVAFDKTMDKASAQAAFSLKRTSDGAPVSGSFGWYGPGVLLFKPSADLAAATQYTASVSTAAKDSAGNPLQVAKTWQFTTATPPVINGVSPADGATGVSPSSLTIAYFNKAMDKAATQAAFSLKRTSDGAPVSGSFGWYGPGVLLFKPDADLAPGTQYTASVSTAAKDLQGNALANPVTWIYATG
jgi:glucose/arabinose dehydrogenase